MEINKSAEKSKRTYRFKVGKNMLNPMGTLHGGELVKEYDNAAGYTAVKYSEGRVVTAAIKEVNFKKKVTEGQTVEIRTKVFHVGRSSIHIHAAGYIVSDNELLEKIGTAYLIFVAIDDDYNPRISPNLFFETEEARNQAEKLKKMYEL